jgi:hypothetical protein
MKRVAAVLLMAGSLTMAGQASAHGHGGDGGAVVGALLGGAVIGALVGSAVNAQPVYAQPVYAQPVYAQPVYQPVYAQPGPPPGYCYDDYRRAYVACGAQPQQGYYQQQQGW